MTLEIENYISKYKSLSWQDRIIKVASESDKVIFSTSFSIEDQIITHIIGENKLNISIFTLDTGRHFEETYKVWQDTMEKYSLEIKSYIPNQDHINDFLVKNGPNSIYKSAELRHKCCEIRKVNPLKKALLGQEIWISGIRHEHSKLRQNKSIYEYDDIFKIKKLYPVIELTEQEVKDYINQNNIPYNKLYDKGYASIGCQPCTRAINPGDDIRSGRWWWEDNDSQECGLHYVNGKLVRKKK